MLTFREVAFPQNLTEVGKSLNSEDEKEEISTTFESISDQKK